MNGRMSVACAVSVSLGSSRSPSNNTQSSHQSEIHTEKQMIAVLPWNRSPLQLPLRFAQSASSSLVDLGGVMRHSQDASATTTALGPGRWSETSTGAHSLTSCHT